MMLLWVVAHCVGVVVGDVVGVVFGAVGAGIVGSCGIIVGGGVFGGAVVEALVGVIVVFQEFIVVQGLIVVGGGVFEVEVVVVGVVAWSIDSRC